MLKLNMTRFLLVLFLIICHDMSVNGQFESPRRFSGFLNQNDHNRSQIIKNLIHKQRLVEQERNDALRRKQEQDENLMRDIFHQYLLKNLKGNAAVLYDFYSRF